MAQQKNAQFIVGIDLGTTNCTISYAKIPQEIKEKHTPTPEIALQTIEQEIALGEVEEKLMLPSFLYYPLAEEDNLIATKRSKSNYLLGEFAKKRGLEISDRLIASAKSWLCHSGIDRRADILPLDAPEDVQKLSPVAACSKTISYLKEAWKKAHPKDPLENQEVYITVPASFDPSARALVQEAITEAGLADVSLLEEPQAAFYSWLHNNEAHWRKALNVQDTILVVDIGGGTTDFSLIAVEDSDGNLGLRRIAVGSHLLLGGDNFDLALAYYIAAKFEEAGSVLDDWQMRNLVQLSREAKEQLLGDTPQETFEIVLAGKGSKLIGKSLKMTISKNEVLTILVDGFFPLVQANEQSQQETFLGMREIGLPFVKDPRITSQLAKFLSRTGETDSQSLDSFIVPTKVLFNGGSMKAHMFKKRLVDVLNSWATLLNKPHVEILEGEDLDFGVSRGAVSYGLTKHGFGMRIRGGTSRSYFIGVEEARPAVPGFPTPIKALCVVPYGMEEGTEEKLGSKEFSLVLGQPVQFRFFSRSTPELSTGAEAKIGQEVKNVKRELLELHPIEAVLPKEENDSEVVNVKLLSKVTELGMLELYCTAKDGRKWKLEFDLRKQENADTVKV